MSSEITRVNLFTNGEFESPPKKRSKLDKNTQTIFAKTLSSPGLGNYTEGDSYEFSEINEKSKKDSKDTTVIRRVEKGERIVLPSLHLSFLEASAQGTYSQGPSSSSLSQPQRTEEWDHSPMRSSALPTPGSSAPGTSFSSLSQPQRTGEWDHSPMRSSALPTPGSSAPGTSFSSLSQPQRTEEWDHSPMRSFALPTPGSSAPGTSSSSLSQPQRTEEWDHSPMRSFALPTPGSSAPGTSFSSLSQPQRTGEWDHSPMRSFALPTPGSSAPGTSSSSSSQPQRTEGWDFSPMRSFALPTSEASSSSLSQPQRTEEWDFSPVRSSALQASEESALGTSSSSSSQPQKTEDRGFSPIFRCALPDLEGFTFGTALGSSLVPPKIPAKGLDKGDTGSEEFLVSIETPQETKSRLQGLRVIGEGQQSVAYVNESKTEVTKYIKLYEIKHKRAKKRNLEDVQILLNAIESNYHHLNSAGLSVAPIINARVDLRGVPIKGVLARDLHIRAPYLPGDLSGEDLLKANVQKSIKDFLEHPYSEGGINIDFNVDNFMMSKEGEVFLIDVDNVEIINEEGQRFSIQKFIEHVFAKVKEASEEEPARQVVNNLIRNLPQKVKQGCLLSLPPAPSESKSS